MKTNNISNNPLVNVPTGHNQGDNTLVKAGIGFNTEMMTHAATAYVHTSIHTHTCPTTHMLTCAMKQYWNGAGLTKLNNMSHLLFLGKGISSLNKLTVHICSLYLLTVFSLSSSFLNPPPYYFII